MAYGWQIFNESGVLVADHTVVTSRRLGVLTIPFIKGSAAGWSQTFNAPFNGGTPFVHCTLRTGVTTPGDGAFAIAIPDIVISGNTVKVSYNAKHFSYPDDLGTALYLGNLLLHYGVYTQ